MGGKRERWDSRSAFVLAAIGSAIGLGNVWRFPYIAYDNGGGAFLIPYFVALLTAGIPLMILEMGVGQILQGGAPTALAKVKKSFEWVGWYAILVAAVITFYYCVIMAWAMNYLIHSLTLKWSNWTPEGAIPANPAEGITYEGAFFNDFILRVSDGPQHLGNISTPLIIGLAITWFLIYLSIRKGVLTVGKVVLVTVPLPFVLLIILFFRGITLPGAIDGIEAYLHPDFNALKDINVWAAAFGQIFFSLSVGFGVMIAYASFRPKNSDIVNNAFITSLANCGTSFFAGFAVFSILGYMANVQGKEVAEVASSGLGLAFVAFPTAITLLPVGAQIVAVLFFLMLLALGIDSAFSLVEAASTAFSDELKINRHLTTVILCVIGFIAGLVFITDGGLHWLDIIDNWMNAWGLMVVAFFEALLIGWFFNIGHLRDKIDQCSEIKAGKWWPFMIKWVATPILGIIIVWNYINESQHPYGNGAYPEWALQQGGWGIMFVLLVLSFLLSTGGTSEFISKEEAAK
ncbi:MAG TPA: sodium-dependent transporter [bacterium]|jgi:NSS family neurotransmitter:Na+ symporter